MLCTKYNTFSKNMSIELLLFFFRTCALSLILALYLSKVKMPVPVWTRKKGCRTVRYPFHQVFAVIIQEPGRLYHYSNISVQYTAICHDRKIDNFQKKKCVIFA